MKWSRLPLSEIASKIDYGVTASAKSEPIGPRFLRITDIQDGAVNWSTVPHCDAPEKKLKSALLQSGDIVFARTGATTGKSFLLTDLHEAAVFASYLIRVRPSPDVIPSYLAHFFQTPDYWQQIKSNQNLKVPHRKASTRPSFPLCKFHFPLSTSSAASPRY